MFSSFLSHFILGCIHCSGSIDGAVAGNWCLEGVETSAAAVVVAEVADNSLVLALVVRPSLSSLGGADGVVARLQRAWAGRIRVGEDSTGQGQGHAISQALVSVSVSIGGLTEVAGTAAGTDFDGFEEGNSIAVAAGSFEVAGMVNSATALQGFDWNFDRSWWHTRDGDLGTEEQQQ